MWEEAILVHCYSWGPTGSLGCLPGPLLTDEPWTPGIISPEKLPEALLILLASTLELGESSSGAKCWSPSMGLPVLQCLGPHVLCCLGSFPCFQTDVLEILYPAFLILLDPIQSGLENVCMIFIYSYLLQWVWKRKPLRVPRAISQTFSQMKNSANNNFENPSENRGTLWSSSLRCPNIFSNIPGGLLRQAISKAFLCLCFVSPKLPQQDRLCPHTHTQQPASYTSTYSQR